jgi:hypothetical protein
VDITDHDACDKLARWFDDRWSDKWCLDISQEIADIIDQSRAHPEPIPPHHIYVKMAYYLSQEAREGIVRYPDSWYGWIKEPANGRETYIIESKLLHLPQGRIPDRLNSSPPKGGGTCAE